MTTNESRDPMSLPNQAPPVRRPELVQPNDIAEFVLGGPEGPVTQRIRRLYDANVNAPQSFAYPSVERMKVSAW